MITMKVAVSARCSVVTGQSSLPQSTAGIIVVNSTTLTVPHQGTDPTHYRISVKVENLVAVNIFFIVIKLKHNIN